MFIIINKALKNKNVKTGSDKTQIMLFFKIVIISNAYFKVNFNNLISWSETYIKKF